MAADPSVKQQAQDENGLGPSLILGTAGHIDHGKSSLVKALTGVDPDRLAEEKRRGITIELGFARLDLPSGRHMGVVDVPGHERFVRHMVAGATGVDVALLVIAADDGVMPQTIEHMAVLELLGVKSAVVALTKVDLVDPDWADFIEADIQERLAQTPYAGAPIVRVSSKTGEGLEGLRQAIDDAADAAVRSKEDGSMRMPVDRVFTVRGIGTVVTGTLWSGQVRIDDALVVLPEGDSTRVRSVQMHGEPVEVAEAGNRVALSLAGLSTDDIRPGDFLCDPGHASMSDRFDARFTYLDPFSFGKPLHTGARVHVAHGTREVLGRILLMDDAQELASGQSALVQVRLEEPLPLAYRDRFVVRSYSPVHVIGGGEVLSPHPRRRTNLKDEEHEMLAALEEGDVERAIGAHLELARLPESAEDIASAIGLELGAITRALAAMERESRISTLEASGAKGAYYARPALLQSLVSRLDRALLEFHGTQPADVGMSKEALREKVLPNASQEVFDAIVAEGALRGAIVVESGVVSHPKASAGAKQQVNAAASTIEKVLAEADGVPPDLADIAQKTKLDLAVARKAALQLVNEGRVVRVANDRYYHTGVIERYKKAIEDAIEKNGPSTAAQLKEAMETSRKYAVPLLEYFDAQGFTRRDGDLRTLSKR